MRFRSTLALGMALSTCAAVAARPTKVGEDQHEGFEGLGFGFPLMLAAEATSSARADEPHSQNSKLPHFSMASKRQLPTLQSSEFVTDDRPADTPVPAHVGIEEFLQSAKQRAADPDVASRIQAAEEHSERGRALNVFGRDDRIVLNPRILDTFPARTIAHLLPVGCTATIVSEYIALTNAHCVEDDDGNLRPKFWSDYHILVGRAKSEFNYAVYFERVVRGEESDFALLFMEQPLGLYTGFPGIKWHGGRYSEIQLNNKDQTLMSYSATFFSVHNSPGGHFGCSFRYSYFYGKYLYHDCDSTPGASGSSLMEGVKLKYRKGRPIVSASSDGVYITALTFASKRPEDSNGLYLPEYSHDKANVAVPTYDFRQAFLENQSWESAAKMCHPGCPDQWLGNGRCDEVCNTKSCAYDWDDCRRPLIKPGKKLEGFVLLGNGACTGEEQASPLNTSTQCRSWDECAIEGCFAACKASKLCKGVELNSRSGKCMLINENVKSFTPSTKKICFQRVKESVTPLDFTFSFGGICRSSVLAYACKPGRTCSLGACMAKCKKEKWCVAIEYSLRRNKKYAGTCLMYKDFPARFVKTSSARCYTRGADMRLLESNFNKIGDGFCKGPAKTPDIYEMACTSKSLCTMSSCLGFCRAKQWCRGVEFQDGICKVYKSPITRVVSDATAQCYEFIRP